ncbi:hypothetical protein CVT26_003201 [Gymnopilus dilepis]|uniref:Uncharacterized protein n=1 Tax=Gymnopilus dilepis TaxID=231916 RepID=A0A409Y568_9AGAR|nr:hypothetical protein CVT26_003201 [Gymnopilus dilepis]
MAAVVSQDRLTASRTCHPHNAFSSLNSRQANSVPLSLIVEDDDLSSYEEDDDDDDVATSPALAGGQSSQMGGPIFPSQNISPGRPQQVSQASTASGTSTGGPAAIAVDHTEYDPAHPHFDNLTSAGSCPSSAFPPPLQGSVVSAFPHHPAGTSSHSDSTPYVHAPEFASNIRNSNHAPLGRHSRWDVGPAHAIGTQTNHQTAPPRPPGGQQWQQHKQPGIGSHNPRPATPVTNQQRRGYPTPNVQHSGYRNHWVYPPSMEARTYCQRSTEVQDPRLKFRNPAYQQQQQRSQTTNPPDQMDVKVSEETAAAFLNNVLNALHNSGVVGKPPIRNHGSVDVEMGPPPILVHSVPPPIVSFDHEMAMDTSPCFRGPSYIVVENMNLEQDMDIDTQPVISCAAPLQPIVQCNVTVFPPGYGHSLPQRAPANVVPNVGGPAALSPPFVTVNTHVAPAGRMSHLQPCQQLPIEMDVDDDSLQPSDTRAHASTPAGLQPSHSEAASSIHPQQSHCPNTSLKAARPLQESQTINTGKVQTRISMAAADSPTSPLASKSKIQPTPTALRPICGQEKVKPGLAKGKEKVLGDKENVPQHSLSKPQFSGATVSKDSSSTTQVASSFTAQSTAGRPSPARAESSGLSNDTKATLTALPSPAAHEDNALVVYDAKGKGKEKAFASPGVQDLPPKTAIQEARTSSVASKAKEPSQLKLVTKEVASIRKASTTNLGGQKYREAASPRAATPSLHVQGKTKTTRKDAEKHSRPGEASSRHDLVAVQQTVSRIRSRLAKAESLLANLQSQSAEMTELCQLMGACQIKQDVAGEEVITQSPTSYLPPNSPHVVIREYNAGEGADRQCDTGITTTHTSNKSSTKDNILCSYSPTFTPQSTPPRQLVQNYVAAGFQHDEILVCSVTQSAPPKLGQETLEWLSDSTRAIDTPACALPRLSPSTGSSTSAVEDTFKNTKAFESFLPCAPSTPTPLPAISSFAVPCSADRFSVDLIDFGEEKAGDSSSNIPTCTKPMEWTPRAFNADLPTTAIQAAPSEIWDDLASLESSLAFIIGDVESPFSAPRSIFSVDDMLSEEFSEYASLLDKPLVNLATTDKGIETTIQPEVKKVDVAVQVPDQQGEIARYMESATLDIEAINHRLSIEVNSLRPVKASVTINKRKVCNKQRRSRTKRTPRYLDHLTDEPKKRVKLSISDDAVVVSVAEPAKASDVTNLSNNSKTVPAHFLPLIEANEVQESASLQMERTEEKVMPGAFPIDESKIQYGPGISFFDLFEKLRLLCFGW